MHHFWPSLPLHIPYSEGIAHWWDPSWWIYQVVVMTLLLMYLRKLGKRVDRDNLEWAEQNNIVPVDKGSSKRDS